MDITPKIANDKNIITSYGSKGFEIREKFYAKSIIVDIDNIIELEISDLKQFLQDDMTQYLDNKTEILLIGTGEKHQIIDIHIKNALKKQFPNLTINEMNSTSACRTYNILAFEERNVKAILLPIDG